MPTLTDLLAGRVQGRTRDDQTSFILNVGAIGAQFEAVAAAVYQRARKNWARRFRPPGSCRTCATML